MLAHICDVERELEALRERDEKQAKIKQAV
jgi:hypothetical protein